MKVIYIYAAEGLKNGEFRERLHPDKTGDLGADRI